MGNLNLVTTLAKVLALLYTIISHELFHGLIALANGDDTAKRAGRLTLNPLPHLDPMGTLALLVFNFGWARPVPINTNKFRNKRSGLFTVSLAGVGINMVSATLAIFLLSYIPHHLTFIRTLLFFISIYGVGFAVFNLFPLPPLDGSKVIMSFLPSAWTRWIAMNERIFYFLLLFLVATGVMSSIIGPIITTIYSGLLKMFAIG